MSEVDERVEAIKLGDVEASILVGRKGWKPPPKLTLHEWAEEHFRLSTESSAQAGRWKSLPYQVEIMNAMTDPRVTEVTLMKSARLGYALSVDTPIATTSGWSTMGGLKVGDEVFGRDGNITRVTFKSETFVNHDCYLVKFCDGEELIADAGHRWFVEADVSIETIKSRSAGRTGRPKPGASATFAGILNTEDLEFATAQRRSKLAIPNASPLKLPDRELPVPPYVLGAWLGDGDTRTLRLTAHRSDAEEMADNIRASGIDAFVTYRDKRYPNNASVLLGRTSGKKLASAIKNGFSSLGFLRGRRVKFIPRQYLRSSVAQRTELLRGLMDTDGTCSVDGRVEFTNTNKTLSEGVYELAVSLGCKAAFRYRPPQRPGVKPQWRVNFRPPLGLNPFRLARKANRVSSPPKPTIAHRRRVSSVTRISSVPVQCISVDSPDHLFLAGRAMIPTHNTLMITSGVGYYVHQSPCPMLFVEPRVEDVKAFSKDTIAPMVRDVPVLRELMSDDESEAEIDSTLLMKQFPGGYLALIGANSGAGFRRRSCKVVFMDELDAYPPSAGQDGDPYKLAVKRTEYFIDRKIIAGSTPLVAGSSRIEALFNEGDQRRYYVPCPHCGYMDVLVFQQKDSGGHWMRWDEGKPETAAFVCFKNGCLIGHEHKRDMVAKGEWRAAKPFKGHASFHIWTAYSYSPNATWAHIAEEFLDAKRGTETLKTFVNTVLGETWKERGEAPDWEKLYSRRESYEIGTVPKGVKFLTCGVDVQKDRFVVEVKGWGANKESWSIDYLVIPCDTGAEEAWLELDKLLDRKFPSESGAEMTITMMAVDSGYNTQRVYSWVRRHERNRVIAVKGLSGHSQRALVSAPSAVDVLHNGRKLSRGAKVWPVSTDIAKSELYGWLRLPVPVDGRVPAPGFCHFPQYGDDYFKQLTAEQLVPIVNKRTGRMTYEWQVIPNRENHVLDTTVYNRVAAAVLGLDRIRVGPVPTVEAPDVAAPEVPTPVIAPPPPKPRMIRDSTFWNRRGKDDW